MTPRKLSAQVKLGRLEGLRQLRDELAREIENGRQPKAPLAKQLRDTLRDIAELERLVPGGSVVDDLASRRRTRRASAAGEPDTEGQAGV